MTRKNKSFSLDAVQSVGDWIVNYALAQMHKILYDPSGCNELYAYYHHFPCAIYEARSTFKTQDPYRITQPEENQINKAQNTSQVQSEPTRPRCVWSILASLFLTVAMTG